MVSYDDRPADKWSDAAWLLLVVGIGLTVWGVSMGFTRSGPGGIPHRNVEAVVRVVAGGAMVLLALVVATVVAPRLSRFRRSWWMVAMWVTLFVGAVFPFGLLAEATSTFVGGDPISGVAYGFEIMAKAAVGGALLASICTVVWAMLVSKRSSDVLESPKHRP